MAAAAEESWKALFLLPTELHISDSTKRLPTSQLKHSRKAVYLKWKI